MGVAPLGRPVVPLERPGRVVATVQAAPGLEAWAAKVVLGARMGLHTGVVDERDGNCSARR